MYVSRSTPTTDSPSHADVEGAVLIAGGYGVVGAQVARLLRERHPDLPLLLGGRTPDRARALAATLGDATPVAFDVTEPDPLATFGRAPAAIISTVNDPQDRLLATSLERAIPLVDITRWTARVRTALAICAVTPPDAPVMLASGWMAGVAPLLAAWAAGGAHHAVEQVDIAIRYAMTDRAGPDSFAYVDRFADRFETTVDGELRLVPGLSDGRTATFADAAHGRVYRFDTPEQLTLPITLGARTAATRIGFDSRSATAGFVALRRTGALRALAHPLLASVRQALLHQSGNGGAAQLRVDVRHDGDQITAHASDPLGQSHLTAAGTVVGIERLLGLDGAAAPAPGVHFPELHPDPDAAVATLRDCGVEVTRRR